MTGLRATLIVCAILAAIGLVTSLAGPARRIAVIERACCEQPLPLIDALEYAVVEVQADGAVMLNGTKVPQARLDAMIRALAMRHPMVLFDPQAAAPYSDVVNALIAIEASGVAPSRICLKDLGRFRIYEQAPYDEGALDILPQARGVPGPPEIPPGNCATLVQMPPLY